jgi:hypothetical protein
MHKLDGVKTKIFLTGLGVGLILGVGAVLLISFLSGRGRPLPVSPASEDPRIQINVEESYVNRLLAAELASDPRFSDPLVDLRSPNLALVTVNTEVAGIVLRPTVTIQFSVEGSEIQAALLEVDVGGLNVPRGLIEAHLAGLEKEIQDQVKALVAGTLADTKFRVVRVSATETSLVVELGE